MIVCLVDTSVLCELLAVPGKSDPTLHSGLLSAFADKAKNNHSSSLKAISNLSRAQ